MLDELAPGTVSYIRLEIAAPPDMLPADAYFFMNIVGRNKTIDWMNMKTKIRGNDDDDPVVLLPLQSTRSGQWVFRKFDAQDPAIWLEDDLVTSECVYHCHKFIAFVRDELFEVLSSRFPGQLDTETSKCG